MLVLLPTNDAYDVYQSQPINQYQFVKYTLCQGGKCKTRKIFLSLLELMRRMYNENLDGVPMVEHAGNTFVSDMSS